MTVVFKSEIKIFCLFQLLSASALSKWEFDCNLSALHVVFEIPVTKEGSIFL